MAGVAASVQCPYHRAAYSLAASGLPLSRKEACCTYLLDMGYRLGLETGGRPEPYQRQDEAGLTHERKSSPRPPPPQQCSWKRGAADAGHVNFFGLRVAVFRKRNTVVGQ